MAANLNRRPGVGLATCLSLLLACWWAAVRADPPAGWTFHPLDEALCLAGQEQRRLFLYFGRHGCPSCEKTNRESFSDARVAERYKANYVLAYVDSESGNRLRLPSGERITEMELGVRLKVFGTPYFQYAEPDGSPILRAPGFQSAEEFLLFDPFVNGGHFKQQTFAEFKAGQP
jgi:thioredoxin-related protein